MLKVQANRLPAVYVLSDVLVTASAWVLAYVLRFDMGVLPAPKGIPDFDRYLLLILLIAVLWPVVLYFHGLYQIRRGRSRIDEFFSILWSVLLATWVTWGFTMYVRIYHRYQPEMAPQWEYSQLVFAIFIALDVLGLMASRWAIRAWLEGLWASGYGVKNVMVAGTGELGRTVAETLAAHRELGYRVAGFLDAAAAGQVGRWPVLGSFDQAMEVARAHAVEELYIALPLEEHARVLELIQSVGNECLDLKVVPDLVQYATLKAALEDIDGIPIITLNEVPLRGWNSMLKRIMDMVLGSALLMLSLPFLAAIALLIKLRGGPGPILFLQERVSVDGRTFEMYKFRSMYHDAERDTGPIFAASDDARRTPAGAFLRRHNLDELPQLLNVVKGDMSLVGPRPERPPFVAQFKKHVPQYMLRHRVKSGITGWAQVNGWRGNTSIEKRIEHDLYYIENWSLLLDVKILILTLFRGFGQEHAY